MPRRKTKSPSVKMTRWFDHVASDLVDVFPNSEGEFVQVWSAPRRTEGRYVSLSYQRTPGGPTSINWRIKLDEGQWEYIEASGPRRRFCYRGDTHDVRYEEFLPSGRVLVHDDRQGYALRSVWTDEFDWTRLKPKGRPLGDRAIIKRHKDGATFFVATYQQSWSNGKLLTETLVSVEEYLGDQRIKLKEISE